MSDAKINASINNIKNATFVNADAGDFLVEYAKMQRQMLLSWIRQEVEAHRNSLILFLRLSQTGLCTFHAELIHRQRDIKVLVKGGYKVTACQPFDLFPHTEHIETIVALHRTDL